MSQPVAQPNLVASEAPPFTWRFWMVLVLTGVAAGLAGGLLMRLLFLVERLAWGLNRNGFASAVEQASAPRHGVDLILAGLLVGVGGSWIRKVGGRAPSEVNAAVWFHQGRVNTPRALLEAVWSIVNVGLGMSLGREASIKQAGGAAASQFSRWFGIGAAHRRLLVAYGVGAGMAAAYNVPLGGALFAVEVLLGTFSLPVVLPALAASTLATAVSWLLLSPLPIYHISSFPLSLSQGVWATLAGPVLGVSTVVLIRAVGWTARVKLKAWAAVAAPVIVLGLVGVVSIKLPLILGNGQDAVQLAFTERLSNRSLAILPEAKLLAAIACLAVGGSGGLFTPTMTVGALLGGLLGSGWALLWPGAPLGSCAVIGACAMLAASTQGPLSGVVLVMELTRHLDATMVPVLLAVTGATLVARRLDPRTVYTVRLAASPSPGTPGEGRGEGDLMRSGSFILPRSPSP